MNNKESLRRVKNNAQIKLVECPTCKTGYHRTLEQVGKTEQCGVCLEKVVLVERPAAPAAHPRRAKK